MSTEIHAVKLGGRGTGFRFRLWDTTMDRYVTEPLTMTEMKKVLKAEAKAEAAKKLEELLKEIPERIHRATLRGTSSRVFTRNLGTWSQERK